MWVLYESESDKNGNTEKVAKPIASLDECAALCTASDTCKAFSFRENREICRLSVTAATDALVDDNVTDDVGREVDGEGADSLTECKDNPSAGCPGLINLCGLTQLQESCPVTCNTCSDGATSTTQATTTPTAGQVTCHGPQNLAFVLDSSQSMSTDEYKNFMLKFIRLFIESLQTVDQPTESEVAKVAHQSLQG
eukprot:gene22459-14635_t